MVVATAVKTPFRDEEVSALLGQAPSALLGVSPEAEQALAKLGVNTVFDLATSRIFRDARELLPPTTTQATGSPGSGWFRPTG